MIFPWWFSRCSASVRNAIATAGVLGGLTSLLLGGFWIGAAGFVATSYLAKKALVGCPLSIAIDTMEQYGTQQLRHI